MRCACKLEAGSWKPFDIVPWAYSKHLPAVHSKGYDEGSAKVWSECGLADETVD